MTTKYEVVEQISVMGGGFGSSYTDLKTHGYFDTLEEAENEAKNISSKRRSWEIYKATMDEATFSFANELIKRYTWYTQKIENFT